MFPRKAWINVTEKCNNRCVWCYGQHSLSRTKTMPYWQVKRILEQLEQIGCRGCIIIGGEPTLHPQIVEILSYGKKCGIEMSLVSNGRRFSDQAFCEDMINAGLEDGKLTFSMSSSSKEDSEMLNGAPESFEEFELGFDNLTKMGVRPRINIVISRPLLDKLDKMFYWLASREVQGVGINEGAPAVSQKVIDASFTLPPDELGRETMRLFRLGQRLDIRTVFLFNLPFCVLSREDIEELVAARAIQSGCGVRNGSSILFDVNGGLITCNHLTDHPICDSETVREIFETNSLAEFWDSDKMVSIRNASCMYRSDYCKGCEYWDMCAGGCPIFWSYYDPQKFIKGIQRKEVRK